MTLAATGSAVLYTLFLWWFSTGAILWLNRLPRRTFRWSFLAGTAVALASIFGLWASAAITTANSALIAFTCALGLWGWHEMSFLMGFITGPRSLPCPPLTVGVRRFTLATATLIYHELALAATAAALLWLNRGQPNQIGAWTFALLWVCRLSAKLNLYLGVPNFSVEYFPKGLKYLISYLGRRRMNALFPISCAAGVILLSLELKRVVDPTSSAFTVASFSLLLALTALALLEHLFMVMPLPDATLWRWAMPSPPKTNAPLQADI
jgi:putative photosynthetic complex assembly protein 2